MTTTRSDLTGWVLDPANHRLTFEQAMRGMEALVREVASQPRTRWMRGEIAGWRDEAVQVELVCASGNVVVRLADGSLKTVRKHELHAI